MINAVMGMVLANFSSHHPNYLGHMHMAFSLNHRHIKTMRKKTNQEIFYSLTERVKMRLDCVVYV
jgi:hypothetical protein